MIRTSLGAAIVCFAVALVLHAAPLVSTPASDPVETAGGTESTRAALGSSFADLAAGVATPVQPEVSEPDTPRIAPQSEPIRMEAVDEPQAAPMRDAMVPPTESEPERATAIKPKTSAVARAEAPAKPPATPPVQMPNNGAVPVTPPTTAWQTAQPSPSRPTRQARSLETIAPVQTAQPAVNRPTEATVRPAARPERAAPQRKGEPIETSASGPAKPTQQRAGNSSRNAKKGSQTGNRQAEAASQGAGATRANGNASLSNYKGQVFRRISRARRGSVDLRGEVLVTLTISGSGGLSGVRVARGSGSGRLDSIALAQVKRAAPFPPPPDGRSHTFSVRISGR